MKKHPNLHRLKDRGDQKVAAESAVTLRRKIVWESLDVEQKIMIGLHGAVGWRDFQWGVLGVDIVGVPPSYGEGNYFRLLTKYQFPSAGVTSVDDPDAPLIASIYLASIGLSL